MENRQHHAIASGIQELVGMPTRGKRSRFGLAITNDTNGQQIRIIKHRAVRMGQRITELATFINRSGGLGRDVAGNAAGKGKLLEQFLHARLVLRNVWIELAVCSFKVGISNQAWSTVTGSGYVDHVQVAQLDDTIQVNVNEIQARRCSPMAQQSRFNVFQL